MKEKGFTFAPEAFCDYYEANGWLVGGKTRMKDWKAACRNWARNNYGSAPARPQRVLNAQTYTQRPYTEQSMQELEARRMREILTDED